MTLSKYENSVSVQEEALSALTGLPRQVLQQDRSTSMKWEGIILRRLRRRIRSSTDVTPIREQLLYVGFSGEFIDSTDIVELYHEYFSIKDVTYFLIRYAVAIVLNTVPKVDANGFPAQLHCDATCLDEWNVTSDLRVPLFLRTDYSENSGR